MTDFQMHVVQYISKIQFDDSWHNEKTQRAIMHLLFSRDISLNNVNSERDR